MLEVSTFNIVRLYVDKLTILKVHFLGGNKTNTSKIWFFKNWAFVANLEIFCDLKCSTWAISIRVSFQGLWFEQDRSSSEANMRFYQSDIQRWRRRMDECCLGKCVAVNIRHWISQSDRLLHRYGQTPALPVVQLVSWKDVLEIWQLTTNHNKLKTIKYEETKLYWTKNNTKRQFTPNVNSNLLNIW